MVLFLLGIAEALATGSSSVIEHSSDSSNSDDSSSSVKLITDSSDSSVQESSGAPLKPQSLINTYMIPLALLLTILIAILLIYSRYQRVFFLSFFLSLSSSLFPLHF